MYGVVGMWRRDIKSDNEKEPQKEFNWSRQYRQEFFAQMKQNQDLDLENLVYYRDEHTHYVVVTPTLETVQRFRLLDKNEKDLKEFVNLVATTIVPPEMKGRIPIENGFVNKKSVQIFDFSELSRGVKACRLLSCHVTPKPTTSTPTKTLDIPREYRGAPWNQVSTWNEHDTKCDRFEPKQFQKHICSSCSRLMHDHRRTAVRNAAHVLAGTLMIECEELSFCLSVLNANTLTHTHTQQTNRY